MSLQLTQPLLKGGPQIQYDTDAATNQPNTVAVEVSKGEQLFTHWSVFNRITQFLDPKDWLSCLSFSISYTPLQTMNHSLLKKLFIEQFLRQQMPQRTLDEAYRLACPPPRLLMDSENPQTQVDPEREYAEETAREFFPLLSNLSTSEEDKIWKCLRRSSCLDHSDKEGEKTYGAVTELSEYVILFRRLYKATYGSYESNSPSMRQQMDLLRNSIKICPESLNPNQRNHLLKCAVLLDKLMRKLQERPYISPETNRPHPLEIMPGEEDRAYRNIFSHHYFLQHPISLSTVNGLTSVIQPNGEIKYFLNLPGKDGKLISFEESFKIFRSQYINKFKAALGIVVLTALSSILFFSLWKPEQQKQTNPAFHSPDFLIQCFCPDSTSYSCISTNNPYSCSFVNSGSSSGSSSGSGSGSDCVGSIPQVTPSCQTFINAINGCYPSEESLKNATFIAAVQCVQSLGIPPFVEVSESPPLLQSGAPILITTIVAILTLWFLFRKQ